MVNVESVWMIQERFKHYPIYVVSFLLLYFFFFFIFFALLKR